MPSVCCGLYCVTIVDTCNFLATVYFENNELRILCCAVLYSRTVCQDPCPGETPTNIFHACPVELPRAVASSHPAETTFACELHERSCSRLQHAVLGRLLAGQACKLPVPTNMDAPHESLATAASLLKAHASLKLKESGFHCLRAACSAHCA